MKTVTLSPDDWKEVIEALRYAARFSYVTVESRLAEEIERQLLPEERKIDFWVYQGSPTSRPLAYCESCHPTSPTRGHLEKVHDIPSRAFDLEDMCEHLR